MFEIPRYVKELILRLEDKGFQAYLVGGSVRDFLMGIEAKDYDLTTDARPEDLEELFKDKETILVGKRFGTVNVVNEGRNIEITTFRKEGRYEDGRRPEEIKYSDSLEEDLKRRDFTINAMAYSKKDGIVDLFGGQEDLEKGIIRSVGDPRERFKEDYLRILRGVRFSSRFKFKIEKKCLEAMKEVGAGISRVSWDRIREELFKILMEDRPSYGVRLLDEIGVLKIILPELSRLKDFDQRNPNHSMDVYDHSLCVLDNTEAILALRLAALFHDLGKWTSFSLDDHGIGHFYGHNVEGVKLARDILNRLNTSKRLTRDVENLIHYHMNSKDNIKKPGLKRLIRRFGEEEVDNLFKLQIADIKCSNNNLEDIDKIEARRLEVGRIIDEKEPYQKKQLALDGSDLIELGYREGRIIGSILDFLLEEVVEGRISNKADQLKNLALSRYPLEEN